MTKVAARRRCSALAGLALAGVASLLLVPFETIAPQLRDLPLPRLVAIVQPAVLTLLAVAAGCWLAPKTGLATPLIDALLRRGNAGGVLRRQAATAVPVGVAAGAILIAYGATVGASLAVDSPLARLDLPLATRLLYGGITEEVLTRWGLMSLFVAAGMRAGLRGRRPYVVAIVAAALLFAAGHLPLLLLVRPDASAWTIAAVLAGNAVPGVAFGWLFWRRGLEAAMIAHALAHLLAVTLG